jgi:hypothetical protein
VSKTVRLESPTYKKGDSSGYCERAATLKNVRFDSEKGRPQSGGRPFFRGPILLFGQSLSRGATSA